MSIRIATIDDLSHIVAIYNETISDRIATADTETIAVQSRHAWFEQHKHNRPLWVIEINHQIAGWLSLQDFYGRPAYNATAEVSIYVGKSFRGKGIGRKLLSHLLQSCPQHKVENLVAFVFAHNKPSINLFIQHGFKQWGLLPQVAKLDDQKKDLMILGLRIT